MASDGPGKYRERKSRANKPYERPKGIIRRVTDSVTGLFSTSWLSGWIGGEEEEEGGGSEPQPGPSQAATLAPPGESFIFAHPVTARKPFKPFYPEEGETDSNSQQALGVNEGASTSSGARMSMATSPGGISTSGRSVQLGAESSSSTLTGRRLPIISSTPATMFTSRTKGQLEPRSLPLLTSSTPACDDGSEVSESSADTGVDASVIPRPDERDYQRDLLGLDEESLQTLRESLAKSVPPVPVTQPATALPSLEETRKRPRDLEADHSSIRAEGSVSSRSLFSETGDMTTQPQPSALASKRPRFNVSLYGSPVLSDRSVLSDSTFKASPFYPGKTMYGGASAYRNRRMPVRSSLQTTRAQVKAKTTPRSTDDGGLSQAARRILESLEQMSTPISDAKRIPTPTPGQRGSFLDSVPLYTAAFHRHRPPLRPSAPPSTKLLTPTKVSVQENLATSLLARASHLPDSSINKKNTTAGADLEEPHQSCSEIKKAEQKEEKKSPQEMFVENPAPSLFSKAAAESSAKVSTPSVFKAAADPSQDVFKFGVSSTSSSSASSTFEFTPKPSSSTLPGDLSQASKRFGKMKSKLVDSGRSSIRHEDEVVEESPLLPVPLTLPSLPKISLAVSSPVQSLQNTFGSLPEGFKFSTPEVVDVQVTSETLDSAPKFTFRNPTLIGEGSTSSYEAGTKVPQPQLMFNSSSSSLLSPKLKTTAKKEMATAEKLKEGSILDVLKPKGYSQEKCLSLSPSGEKTLGVTSKGFSLTTNSDSTKSTLEQTVNSVVKKTDTLQGVQGFGSMFKKSSDEWECTVCMLRNQNTCVACVACEAQRPGQSAPSNMLDKVGNFKPGESWAGNGTDWGNAFKKSASEWECDTCMVRNKDSVSKCVACEAPKPGSKTDMKVVQDVVAADTKEKTNFVGFGSMFTKQKGEWECDTCLVQNKSDATKCISCETLKPGAANVSEAITGNFKFGVNNDLPSASSTFKFGLNNSQTEVKTSSVFSFGGGAKSIENKGNSGFKFGVPVEKPNALTVHAFGSSAESDQLKDKIASSSVFNFGVQKADSKDKDAAGERKSQLLVSKASDSIENVTSTTPAFQFGSGTKTHVAFSFDSGTQEKGKDEKSVNTSTAGDTTVGSVQGILEKGKSSLLSKLPPEPKAVDVEGGASKPQFAFNSVTASNKDENTSKSAATPFSVMGNTDAPAPSPAPPPVAAAASTSTAAFGASAGTNTNSSGSGFAFGDKGSNPSAFPSFSYNSPLPPTNKDETKAPLTFSFGSKRDSVETNEPAKKLSFVSATPAPGINNGVNATSSLFTFGSKENKLGTGTGFGIAPASTPAFGAPAPSSNTTASFQFGNSNPPARAATAPSAFGGLAPTFGSSSNSSTPGFAFGQPSEKKSSAGFDFGQAASSTGQPAFNFSATVPQSTTTGLFQFGQGQTNNNAPGGLFQFGSRNAESQAPATFGNSENPFTSGPPSGRVMKRAVRRARK